MQRADSAENRLWRGHVLQRQIIVQSLDVQLHADGRMLQNCFDFRGKDERAACLRKVQRLDAQAVANHK